MGLTWQPRLDTLENTTITNTLHPSTHPSTTPTAVPTETTEPPSGSVGELVRAQVEAGRRCHQVGLAAEQMARDEALAAHGEALAPIYKRIVAALSEADLSFEMLATYHRRQGR